MIEFLIKLDPKKDNMKNTVELEEEKNLLDIH